MKLYVDDIRPAPEGWNQARNVTSAIKAIAMFGDSITEISLDHDISMAVSVGGQYRPFPSDETFQAVAWFMDCYWDSDLTVSERPKVTIHTANPVGALELHSILKDFVVEIKPASSVNRLESEV